MLVICFYEQKISVVMLYKKPPFFGNEDVVYVTFRRRHVIKYTLFGLV